MAGAQDYVQYLMSKGLSRVQATAAIARFIQESSLNPTIKGDKTIPGASVGFGQWNRDRQANLKGFAGDSWQDPYRQLDFFMHEGSGTGGHGGGSEAVAYNRLLAATTPEEAVGAMMDYERPQGWSAGNSAAGHGYRNTLNNYNTVYGGGGPSTSQYAMRSDPRDDTPHSAQPIGSQLPGLTPEQSAGGAAPASPAQVTAAEKGMTAVADAQDKTKSLWDKFGKGLGEGIGGMGGGGGPPTSALPAASPMAALAPTASGGIDPAESEMRRQRLAEAMAKLNSGKLWA